MEYVEKRENRLYMVFKSNELVQKARADLTLQEQKLFAYVASKIKPSDPLGSEYKLSIKDFCEVCGLSISSGTHYENIKSSLKSMRDKSFWITNSDGSETTIGWLGKVRISRQSGTITLKFDEDMEKFLFELVNNYTQYELISILPMTSTYSIRIFELLKSYAFTHVHTFDIEDLKKKLCCEHYVNFKDFRRKVLEVATREINEYSDLIIQWEPISEGRKVTKVKFRIRMKNSIEQFRTANRNMDVIDGQMDIGDLIDTVN